MDVRIHDEALFVVPGSGELWSFDFGKNKRVIRESQAEASDPPFQVAQAWAGDLSLLLVFGNFGPPSIAQQDRIRRILSDHAGTRGVTFVLDHRPGHVALIGSDVEVVEHFAAAAAVVQACWAWDESPTIRVSVDELVFEVVPHFNGEVWTARVERVGAS